MGGALARGLLRSGAAVGTLSVSNPSEEKLRALAAEGASVTTDNRAAAEGADLVVLAVKPWLMEQVAREVAPVLDAERTMVVSVAAGVRAEQLEQWLSQSAAALFTVIPNIAVAQLQSMTFVVPIRATAEQLSAVVELFDAMGCTLVTDEQHLGAATSLASCGIAYAMRYIRAASEGGVELGFRADDAKQIVMQTVRGAVELLDATGLHPEQAIDLVTTPGGLTIRGLNEMEHAGFTSAVVRGLKAGAK